MLNNERTTLDNVGWCSPTITLNKIVFWKKKDNFGWNFFGHRSARGDIGLKKSYVAKGSGKNKTFLFSKQIFNVLVNNRLPYRIPTRMCVHELLIIIAYKTTLILPSSFLTPLISDEQIYDDRRSNHDHPHQSFWLRRLVLYLTLHYPLSNIFGHKSSVTLSDLKVRFMWFLIIALGIEREFDCCFCQVKRLCKGSFVGSVHVLL